MMRTDMDACYIANIVRRYKGNTELLVQYQRLLVAVNRDVSDDWNDEIKREFFSLYKDGDLSKQRQTSFKYFWNHCSSVLTLVWIADALSVDRKLVYDAMYASIDAYEKTHLKQSEAKAFRDIVTFDVVLRACEAKGLSDELFVACANIRKDIFAAFDVCKNANERKRVCNFTQRLIDKYGE